MSATLTGPKRTARPRLSREQAAEQLLPLLTHEPQSMAALTRSLFGPDVSVKTGGEDAIRNALRVLNARGQAKQIPRQGWVLAESEHQAAIAAPREVEFPYEWSVLPLDQMFIDETYQRPLTSFVVKIKNSFSPFLFGVLVLGDRGTKSKPRYPIIDGQTRWWAAKDIGVQEAPCIVLRGLTPQDEARIFAKLQTERRGMTSWNRFRAALAAEEPEALAIKRLVESVGYSLGDGPGQLKSVAALERTYRREDFLLERTLTDLKEAWPDFVPEAPFIKGIHWFFMNFPIGVRVRNPQVDDQRLINRLRSRGPDSLRRKASAVKEAEGKSMSNEKAFAIAIQNMYLEGGGPR